MDSVKTYLLLQEVVILQHVQQLGVVDLQEHAGDLSGQVRVHSLDKREETLAEHLLLLLGRSGGQHGGGERLLALDDDCLLSLRCRGHHLTRHHLGRRVPGGGRVLEGLLRPYLE